MSTSYAGGDYPGEVLRVVVWLLLAGAVLYAVFWLIDLRAGGGSQRQRTPTPRGPRGPQGSRGPQAPRGPDDDEEFLRELDRRRRDGS